MTHSKSETTSLKDAAQDPRPEGLRRVLQWADKAASAFAVALLLLLSAVIVAMTLTRSLLGVGVAWLDDLARYLQIWIVYTAAVSLTMNGEHISMDAVHNVMPPLLQVTINRAVGISSLFFCVVTCYLCVQQAWKVLTMGEVSQSGVFPAILGYASLPIGFGLMAAASLHYLLYAAHRR